MRNPEWTILDVCCSVIKRAAAHMLPPSLSKKSGWSWAFSDRYGRMDKGDARCWNAGKWIEIW